MKLYQFREEGGPHIALTADVLGDRLPRDGRVWQMRGPVDLDDPEVGRIGVSAEEIARAVEQHGHFIWPRD